MNIRVIPVTDPVLSAISYPAVSVTYSSFYVFNVLHVEVVLSYTKAVESAAVHFPPSKAVTEEAEKVFSQKLNASSFPFANFYVKICS